MARPSGRRTQQFHLPPGSPNPSNTAVENNFTMGLKTEFTGLNFPENACTQTFNCRFNRTGEVSRRKGFDFEANNSFFNTDRTNQALSTFLWKNAGGDGNTQLFVAQVGAFLYFYNQSTANIGQPLSTQLIQPPLTMIPFLATGGTFDTTKECQFAAGNGYLFVFNANINPIYITFISGVLTANPITLGIRDFTGIPEPGVADTTRPNTLSIEHSYNLQNQGWVQGTSWSATGSYAINGVGQPVPPFGVYNWNLYFGSTGLGNYSIYVDKTTNVNVGDTAVASGLALHTGENQVYPIGGNVQLTGLVTAKGANFITINVASVSPSGFIGNTNEEAAGGVWTITGGPNTGQINKWFTTFQNYPSNADIWYLYKDTTGVFNPAATIGSVAQNTGPAPKGYYIMNPFHQDRSAISGIQGLTAVNTTARPTTGTFFQGRVWYTGVNANFPAGGDEPFYSWTENIYFSQIIQNTNQFGRCYQTNDPTNEALNQILPTDGGVVNIQGAGSIYKLFPVQNGLLVFAANGIWFITGSSGIGFAATDFTITKISGLHNISNTSYVDVDGWPLFWTEDGIYFVTPGQQGLQVENLVIPTIRSFYATIPLSSKKKARGAYNRITGEVQWVYLSTEAVNFTASYSFDSILNFYTYTKAFYPWTVSPGVNIHDITYIEGPGGVSMAPSVFKYFTSLIGPVITPPAGFSLGNLATNATWLGTTSSTATISVSAGSILLVTITQSNITSQLTTVSVTSPNLTYQKRFSANQKDAHVIDDTFQEVELWWAYSPTALTSEVVTVTSTGTPTSATIGLAEVKGVNPFPWSSNLSCPSGPNFNPDGAVVGFNNPPISSNTSTPVGFWFAGSAQAGSGSPTGWTVFNTISNIQGGSTGLISEIRCGYFVFNAQQINATYTSASGGSDSWIIFVDFMETFSPPVPGAYNFTFAEERDSTNWKDWATLGAVGAVGFPVDYVSSFVTGYKLHGQGVRKWHPEYVYMYTNSNVNSYKVQGVWNYANNINSNKFSTEQVIVNNNVLFDKMYRRHRIRGFGTVFQLRVSSVSGSPFSFSGWAIQEVINQNV